MFLDLTEECPLTKEKSYKHRLCGYCGNGFKFINVCFVALTFAITTMLVLQIIYTENILQVNIKRKKRKNIMIKGSNKILIVLELF